MIQTLQVHSEGPYHGLRRSAGMAATTGEGNNTFSSRFEKRIEALHLTPSTNQSFKFYIRKPMRLSRLRLSRRRRRAKKRLKPRLRLRRDR